MSEDSVARLIKSLDAKLAPLGHFRARRMFGGYGLYLDDTIFGLIIWDRLWLRVDDRNRADFETAGMEPFTYAREDGREISMTYWSCPARVVKDAALLRDWVAKARAASAERKTAARRKKPKKTAAGPNPFL